MKKVRDALRKIIPSLIINAYRRWTAARKIREGWMSRKVTKTDDHLALYWNAESQANRKFLVRLIIKELLSDAKSHDTWSVLEYGSHVGLNLRLIHDSLSSDKPFNFYAVEPNKEAVNFLKQKMEYVNALLAEDEAFCRDNSFPPRHVKLSFVNSVFYCMEGWRAKSVLGKLASISDVIIIGDAMDALEYQNSNLKVNPVRFQHPYRRWLVEMGFELDFFVEAPEPAPQLNGYLIARRAVVAQ
jgi:hypothetical protein